MSRKIRISVAILVLVVTQLACTIGNYEVSYGDGNLHIGSSQLDSTLGVEQP